MKIVPAPPNEIQGPLFAAMDRRRPVTTATEATTGYTLRFAWIWMAQLGRFDREHGTGLEAAALLLRCSDLRPLVE